MSPLDVTHVVMRRWRAGVRGRIDPRIGNRCGGTGLPQGVRLVRVPPNQMCYRTPWRQACVRLCLLGREGPMLG